MHRRLVVLIGLGLSLVTTGWLLAEQASRIEVKVLYDNYVAETGSAGLTKDWGFACLITGTEKPVLFDTGTKGPVLLENIKKLQIGPRSFEAIEQCLVLETKQGLVMVNGCSHPGLAPMVRRVKEEFKRDVWMVLGGMHLLQMPEEKVKGVIAQLKELGVRQVGPTHCAGDKAIALFQEASGENCVRLGVGRVLKF